MVDDDDLVRGVLEAVLSGAGHEVVLAANAAEALDRARASSIAVALVDRGLGATSGIELCRQLRALPAPPSVVVISGACDAEARAEAQAAGAVDLLAKPFSRHELLRQLEQARPAP